MRRVSFIRSRPGFLILHSIDVELPLLEDIGQRLGDKMLLIVIEVIDGLYFVRMRNLVVVVTRVTYLIRK